VGLVPASVHAQTTPTTRAKYEYFTNFVNYNESLCNATARCLLWQWLTWVLRKKPKQLRSAQKEKARLAYDLPSCDEKLNCVTYILYLE